MNATLTRGPHQWDVCAEQGDFQLPAYPTVAVGSSGQPLGTHTTTAAGLGSMVCRRAEGADPSPSLHFRPLAPPLYCRLAGPSAHLTVRLGCHTIGTALFLRVPLQLGPDSICATQFQTLHCLHHALCRAVQ